MHTGIILIVDDMESNRQLVGDLLRPLGHTVLTAENGEQALETVRGKPVDIVLLDIVMPEMDGYAVLDAIKADPALVHLPVIMITGVGEMDSAVRCIKAGADDYLIKPFSQVLLKALIDACIEKKRLYDQEEYYRMQIEEINQQLGRRVREQVKELTAAHLATIFALSKLAESRDADTREHLDRMREYVMILCDELRKNPQYAAVIDDDYRRNIYNATPLHDVGKVGTPDHILQKPGKLDAEEFDIMKAHAIIGADCLRAVDRQHPHNDFILMGIQVAETHHERWDGGGYPHGFKGERIPLAGRIVGLADVYDALVSKRCYKEAYAYDRSRVIILEEQGDHFDPAVVDAFIAREKDFIDVHQRFPDVEEVALEDA